MRMIKFLLVSLLSFTSIEVSALHAQVVTPDMSIYDAWSYLLGRAIIVRQEKIDTNNSDVGYNVIRKHKAPTDASFVNPNFDVTYFESWIAVDDHSAAYLYIPKIDDRYYTIQILNEFGGNVTNINNRAFPNHPFGYFALITANSKINVPAGYVPIVIPGYKAKLLGRIELKNTPQVAYQLQDKITLTMSGKPYIMPPPIVPTFTNDELPGIELFDNAESILRSAPDYTPVAAEIQQSVRDITREALSSHQRRQFLNARIMQHVIPAFIKEAHYGTAIFKNNWLGGHREGRGYNGNYGIDYRMRTAINLLGIWANTPEEAVYFLSSRDETNKSLNGKNNYRLHFPANALPETMANAFWSLTLVSVPDYQAIPNSLKRYNINNYSDLKKNSDGSLDIVIGPKTPLHVPDTNWLPSATDKNYALVFRLYVPKASVIAGNIFPPAVSLITSGEF
jgi:hypothetical protein